jgi:hypothetical protein
MAPRGNLRQCNPAHLARLGDGGLKSPHPEFLRSEGGVFRHKVSLTIWLEIYGNPGGARLGYDDVAAVNYDP